MTKVIFGNTANTSNEVSAEKRYTVGRVAGVNSITSNIIALTEYHQLSEGETIRFESDSGQLPDGIDENNLYFTITSGVATDSLKIAKTLNEFEWSGDFYQQSWWNSEGHLQSC